MKSNKLIVLRNELQLLQKMIQMPTGLRISCNFEMYKDDVTKYRVKLMKQTEKVIKAYNKMINAGLI